MTKCVHKADLDPDVSTPVPVKTKHRVTQYLDVVVVLLVFMDKIVN